MSDFDARAALDRWLDYVDPFPDHPAVALRLRPIRDRCILVLDRDWERLLNEIDAAYAAGQRSVYDALHGPDHAGDIEHLLTRLDARGRETLHVLLAMGIRTGQRAERARVLALTQYNCDCLPEYHDGEPIYCERNVILVADLRAEGEGP